MGGNISKKTDLNGDIPNYKESITSKKLGKIITADWYYTDTNTDDLSPKTRREITKKRKQLSKKLKYNWLTRRAFCLNVDGTVGEQSIIMRVGALGVYVNPLYFGCYECGVECSYVFTSNRYSFGNYQKSDNTWDVNKTVYEVFWGRVKHKSYCTLKRNWFIDKNFTQKSCGIPPSKIQSDKERSVILDRNTTSQCYFVKCTGMVYGDGTRNLGTNQHVDIEKKDTDKLKECIDYHKRRMIKNREDIKLKKSHMI